MAQESTFSSRRRVGLTLPEVEIEAFLILCEGRGPLDCISAFCTEEKSLRRMRNILRFICSFSRRSKTSQILALVEDILRDPMIARRPVVITENYMFVKTNFRAEIASGYQMSASTAWLGHKVRNRVIRVWPLFILSSDTVRTCQKEFK